MPAAPFEHDATADFRIELTGHKTLTAGDFIFG